MESIMTEGFDNAALEANFEQKLDDKIANLQPEWTGFKEDVTTQLADAMDYSTTKSNLTDAGGEKKCIVSFIADDAPKNDLDLFIPIMEEYNLPYGIGVITNRVGGSIVYQGETVNYMDWDEIRDVKRRGGEILAHSHNHKD